MRRAPIFTSAIGALLLLACFESGSLPIVLVEPDADADPACAEWLAVFVSGDGGWASTDAEIADRLADRGIPTIGLSALRFFWFEKSREEVDAALRTLLETYLPRFDRRRALLIGFSRGANTLPFMVDGLPPALRGRVGQVVLISPTHATDFVFRMRDWFEIRTYPDSMPVAPAVEAMAPIPVVCVYGREDTHALCPDLPPHTAEIIALPGGHHFGGETDAVTRDIITRVCETG